MSTNSKDLRKQLRTVIQEFLPELLTKEVVEAISKEMLVRVAKLEKETKDTMHQMNERHKDVMSYLVRQVSEPKIK